MTTSNLYHQATGDGGPATLGRLGTTNIRGLAPDVAGDGFVFSDFGWTGVRRVSAAGILSTIAGTNLPVSASSVSSRLSGPGFSSRLNQPRVIQPDSSNPDTLAILES